MLTTFSFLNETTATPSANRFWLFGEAGLPKFLRFHNALQQEVFKRPKCPSMLILDWDTTVLTVYGRQEKAAVGYNPKKRGRRSYLPLLCLEGQTRDCWDASYHPGNVHPGSIFLPAFQRAFAKVPHGVQEIRVRADQAFYDREMIEFIEGKRAFYVIAAHLTRPIQERVTAVRYHRVSGETYAAEFHYQPLAVFAYNLLNWFKRLCVTPEWQKLTLQTLRNRLLLIPAELVRPQGRWMLKMPRGYPHQDQFLKTLKRIDGFRLT